MLSKYISHWLIFVFLIWMVCYQVGYTSIAKEINPYYSVLALFWGFLFLSSYMILGLGFQFELSFFIFLFLMHSVPLLAMIYLNPSHTNSLRTLLMIVILYIIYIKYQGRGLTDSYFKDTYPKSWKDLRAFCAGKPNPVCQIMRFLN